MKATIRTTPDGRLEVSVEGHDQHLIGDRLEVESAPTQSGALVWVPTDEGLQVLYVGDEPVDEPLVTYIAARHATTH